MTKTTAKTTITYKEVTFPFYRTIRGRWDFEQAGFSNQDIAAGKISAMYAYIYFQLRDCAKRAGLDFKYSLDKFIDEADGDELEVYGRLLEEESKLIEMEDAEPGKQEPAQAKP